MFQFFNPTQTSTTLSSLVTGEIYNMVWEITNGVCPVSRDTVRVFNQFVPVASFIQDATEICQNDSVTFTSICTMTLPETITSEVWKIKSTTKAGTFHPEVFTTPGFHDVTLYVTASNGCSDTVEMKDAVFVHTNPIADFSLYTDPNDDYKMQVYVRDLAQNTTDYTYKFGDGSTSQLTDPTHLYRDFGLYGVWQIVKNNFGRIDSTFRNIYVQQVMAYIPTAFTPNNDGLNDVFLPIVSGNDKQKYEFFVVNRWGEEIFRTADYLEGWDGTHNGNPCQIDTYVWKIMYKESNGTEVEETEGHVNLIR